MKRSDEVESFVQRLYEGLRAGDADSLARMVADDDDALMIGTDPGEWVESTSAIRAALHEQTQAMGGGLDIEPRDLHGYAEGDVGWFADQPRSRLPDGTELTVRVTGVVTRSHGGWVLHQVHWSAPASLNDVLFTNTAPST